MDYSFSKTDWDEYAQWYDALSHLRPYSQMLDEVIQALGGAAYPLLCAGCGTGNLIARLPARQRQRTFAIDASRSMLERAERKCRGPAYVLADLDAALPFSDEVFGTVVSVNTLYAVAKPSKTLLEFRRVLRKGGKLVIVTPRHDYESGLILKAHCRSEKPDQYWRGAHESATREETLVREAIADEALAQRFLHIARINRLIAATRSFRFFAPEALACAVHQSGFIVTRLSPTYAGQNVLLTAIRDDRGFL